MQSNIQLIRNATVVFNYAGKKFLIDPMLADKGTYPGFPGTPNSELNNPLVNLPVKAESIVNVDAVLVSHLHLDHWDEAAAQALPKNIKIMAQNEDDAKAIQAQGFTNVEAIAEVADFEGLQITKTHCQHGSDLAYSVPHLADFLGKASGFYFNAAGEKSVYFIGDTVWIEEVENNLKTWQPDIVVVNAGLASLADEQFGGVITGKEDVERIHNLLPNATIIAIHMEALNHCLVTRADLKAFVEEKGFADKVIIPNDGETIYL